VVSDEDARADVSKILETAGLPAEVVRIDVEKSQEPLIGLRDYNRPKIENERAADWLCGRFVLPADCQLPGSAVSSLPQS
jgi:hypothetical protein